MKSGDITPLFINKSFRIPFNEWLEAESHPTKGFKVRPYWHCTSEPNNQGGLWFLANKIKFIKII